MSPTLGNLIGHPMDAMIFQKSNECQVRDDLPKSNECNNKRSIRFFLGGEKKKNT